MEEEEGGGGRAGWRRRRAVGAGPARAAESDSALTFPAPGAFECLAVVSFVLHPLAAASPRVTALSAVAGSLLLSGVSKIRTSESKRKTG